MGSESFFSVSAIPPGMQPTRLKQTVTKYTLFSRVIEPCRGSSVVLSTRQTVSAYTLVTPYKPVARTVPLEPKCLSRGLHSFDRTPETQVRVSRWTLFPVISHGNVCRDRTGAGTPSFTSLAIRRTNIKCPVVHRLPRKGKNPHPWGGSRLQKGSTRRDAKEVSS